MKPAFFLLSTAFTLACGGLWWMMRILRMLIIAHYPPNALLGDFHVFCLDHAFWLLLLPIPVVCYVSFVVVRGKASVERFCGFASALALVFVALFFTVVACCMSCWVFLTKPV